jgi:hypothetical protein
MGDGRVLFRDGAICSAETSRLREPLGRKLVRTGVLSETQLWNALRRQDKTHLKLGETLISSGLAAADHVHSALREQARDSIVDVLRLELSEFTWRSETREEPIVFPVEELLSALSESVEEIRTIRDHIPSDGSTVALAPMTPEPGEIRLSLEEWRVIVLLGSRRKVHDLSRYSGSGETQTLRVLDRLVQRGILEVAAPAKEHGGSSAQPGGRYAAIRGFPPAPPRRVSAHAHVIRLPDDGDTTVLEQDTFKIAFLGRAPDGLSRRAGTVFSQLVGDAPMTLETFCLGDPHDMSTRGEAQEPHHAQNLDAGALAHMDLVMCFDWSQVEDAVSIGGAAPERTFTLLELWALIDTRGPVADGIQRGREAVERANSRRIRKAKLLSILEMAEAEESRDEQVKLNEICARIAEALFG